jgi:hypothetical protein
MEESSSCWRLPLAIVTTCIARRVVWGSLQRVEVEASATFAGVGLAASDVRYRAKVESTASPQAVVRLLRETDAVAEVHNTLRKGVPVQLLG